MRILISGGPGSGCTSTAELIAAKLGLPVFDTDTFFHKPTDPPFQEQYSPDERRQLIATALGGTTDWILSGSISTWDVDLPIIHIGAFLDTPKEERLRRLEQRERGRFGSRIDVGGDLHTENMDFMAWASEYEDRSGRGRNRDTDRAFVMQQCEYFIEISRPQSLDEITSEICGFLANPRSTTSRHS